VSAISGFCEKCNKFRKRHCDGNRNTCMSILFDTIEALQQENEQPRAQVEMMRETLEKARKVLHKLRAYEIPGFGETCEALAEIDKAIGGKEDV